MFTLNIYCVYIFLFIIFIGYFNSIFILTGKNLIISLLFLVVTYFICAVFLLFITQDYLGFLLFIIYLGAIAILFIFALIIYDTTVSSLKKHLPNSFFIKIAIINLFIVNLFFSNILPVKKYLMFFLLEKPQKEFLNYKLQELGDTFFSTFYSYLILLAGLFLLVLLIAVLNITYTKINQ